MRYLLDTCVYIYLVTDRDRLHPDVLSVLSEPDALWCISAESVRELIVAYDNKGWGATGNGSVSQTWCAPSKRPTSWKSCPLGKR